MLDRFDDYWEGPANYQRYVFRIIPDLLTQEMEFYAGTIDSYGVQPHQVKRLEKDPRFENFSGVAFGYTYIGYNMRRKLFNDPRIRRALGMAIVIMSVRCTIVLMVQRIGKRPCHYGMMTEESADIPQDIVAASLI